MPIHNSNPAPLINTGIATGTTITTPSGNLVFNGNNWTLVLPTYVDDIVAVTMSSVVKHSNSKRLLAEIMEVVEDAANSLIVVRNFMGRSYDFADLQMFLDEYMIDMQDRNLITNYDVIADFRNNKEEDVRAGTIRTTISFQQYNCLNTTEIAFTFQVN